MSADRHDHANDHPDSPDTPDRPVTLPPAFTSAIAEAVLNIRLWLVQANRYTASTIELDEVTRREISVAVGAAAGAAMMADQAARQGNLLASLTQCQQEKEQLQARARFEYRKDGWPLCPGCGDDELASVVALQGEWPASQKVEPTDEMRCYNCRWVGTVPAQNAAESRLTLLCSALEALRDEMQQSVMFRANGTNHYFYLAQQWEQRLTALIGDRGSEHGGNERVKD